jgi:hypothetical protein
VIYLLAFASYSFQIFAIELPVLNMFDFLSLGVFLVEQCCSWAGMTCCLKTECSVCVPAKLCWKCDPPKEVHYESIWNLLNWTFGEYRPIFFSNYSTVVEYNNIKVNGALIGMTVKTHSTLCCVETNLYCSVVINCVEKVCDTFSIT